VGLADTAVQESKERVRAAIRNSGVEFPMRRIALSLAPADVRKSGPAYDLPIAVGILTSTGQVPEIDKQSLLLGELPLDGKLRSTQGILPMVALGKKQGFTRAFVPTIKAKEASLVHGIKVIPIDSLTEMVEYLRGEKNIEAMNGERNRIYGVSFIGGAGTRSFRCPRTRAREESSRGSGSWCTQPTDGRTSG